MTLSQGHLRPSETTDIYIMISNSSKVTLLSSSEQKFMVGGWSSKHKELF